MFAPKNRPVKKTGRDTPVRVNTHIPYNKRMANRKAAYDSYMASAEWRERREEYYRSRDKVCAACGGRNQIHLHHRTYVRMGKEWDQDLLPLCENCHKQVHDFHKRHTFCLEVATDRAVGLIRAGKPLGRRKQPRRKSGGGRRRKNRGRGQPRYPDRAPAGRRDPVNEALADIEAQRV